MAVLTRLCSKPNISLL